MNVWDCLEKRVFDIRARISVMKLHGYPERRNIMRRLRMELRHAVELAEYANGLEE